MTCSWKLILDALFALSVTGALGNAIFVEQKRVFIYINMSLVFILCLIYSLYFSSVRKSELIKWLEDYRSVAGPCVTRIKRSLRNFMFVGLLHRALLNRLNFVIGLMYLPFPVWMLITATTCENLTTSATSTILGIGSIFYVLSVMQFAPRLKMRFRVRLHGGSLLIFTGMFLISSDYGIVEHFTGVGMIIVGICFYYDIWKQYFMGVRLRIDPEAESNSNGDVGDRTETSMSLLGRTRRLFFNIRV